MLVLGERGRERAGGGGGGVGAGLMMQAEDWWSLLEPWGGQLRLSGLQWCGHEYRVIGMLEGRSAGSSSCRAAHLDNPTTRQAERPV